MTENQKIPACRLEGKIKNQNYISKFKNFAFWFVILIFDICILHFSLYSVYAKEITILYTGSTHAMLYPCNCPIEPDGGIARRATLIKQLKKGYPGGLLVLDSGNFFAGGLFDEYTQNAQLDMQRTLVNLKAMELMKYDALTLGDDEFNFGVEFLEKNIAKTGLTFLSCNIKDIKASPYIIKEVLGLKIGIIGVTNLSARQKAVGIKFIAPEIAINQAVAELKNKGVTIVVLLSNLGESQDLNLLENIKGIDIIIDGYERSKEGAWTKIKDTLVLRPIWQGRRLGKVSLFIRDNKIVDYKVEELRLSDEIADEPTILSILPRCFSDNNCKKEGLLGVCQNPGSIDSQCVFSKANKINLLIITSLDCLTCNTKAVIDFLKSQIPGLTISYLNYPDHKAKKLIKDFAITALPVYFLDKEIEKEKIFDRLKGNLELKGKFYMLKPQFSGFSYFLGRKKIKGRLDLFLSLYDKNTRELLEVIKEFNPTIHFLIVEQADRFEAAGGNLEVEEYLRGVCVQKYYPEIFWDYMGCRAKNINSSWWDDCLGKFNPEKIVSCARGPEGILLLRENISFNKELQIMLGPTYLLDNQEIFSTKGTPTREEFKKIFKK
jgi:5'-nucleotidase